MLQSGAPAQEARRSVPTRHSAVNDMANKFTGLDEAATQLGVSKDKLNELREAGELRAYRDGASWKFRTEDIEKIQADPSSLEAEPSGIDLDEFSLDDGLSSLSFDDKPGEAEQQKQAESPASDLDLEMLDEPTVPVESETAEVGESSDVGLGDELELSDDNDSILLSEEEFGDSPDRPPSTIIGRSQLEEEPSDDDLLIGAEPTKGPGMSDVRLAVADDEADIDGALSSEESPAAGMFDDLEELEIDLEAESSRILEEQDVSAAQEAAKKMAEASDSDLPLGSQGDTGELSPAEDTGSKVELAPDENDDLELDLADSGVELKADGSDDMVLDADDDDEGFSLSASDSGINLKPSDSGLVLDDGSFALGGSAVGSSLDLGDSLGGDSFAVGEQSEVSLEGSTAFTSSPDFNLQPSDDEDDEDEEDSSQIIALDAIEETEEEDDDGVIVGDAVSPAMGMSQAPVMAPEAAFPVWIVAFLFVSAMLMLVTTVMAADLLRSMWAWGEPHSLNSPLIEGFLGLVGLNK